MTENIYASRRKIAIAMAGAIETQRSLTGTQEGACVPITVAFTHGKDSLAQRIDGLGVSPSMSEVWSGAQRLAELHGQQVTHTSIDTQDIERFVEELAESLEAISVAWILYKTDIAKDGKVGGHIVGLMGVGENRYARIDTNNIPYASYVSAKEVAVRIDDERLSSYHGAYVLRFE